MKLYTPSQPWIKTKMHCRFSPSTIDAWQSIKYASISSKQHRTTDRDERQSTTALEKQQTTLWTTENVDGQIDNYCKLRLLSPENQQLTTMTDTQRDWQTAFALTCAFIILYYLMFVNFFTLKDLIIFFPSSLQIEPENRRLRPKFYY